MSSAEALVHTELPDLPPPRRGKVRDVYDLDDALLLVATDRLSAYDHVLEPAIPDKGRVLTRLSNFWFHHLSGRVPHHVLATRSEDFPEILQPYRSLLDGRAVLVEKTQVVPFECVARGYLAGSGYRDYLATGRVCGVELPAGLERASQLPEPIFTPATKAEAGHDENVTYETMADAVGAALAAHLRELTLELYERAAAHAAERGLILADTKLEFGLDGDQRVVWIDEAFTPDSSRYWDASAWTPGEEPASFDKQYVRNWLDDSGWDHESPPPTLPPEVVEGTRQRYREAFRRLTGHDLDD